MLLLVRVDPILLPKGCWLSFDYADRDTNAGLIRLFEVTTHGGLRFSYSLFSRHVICASSSVSAMMVLS